MDFVVVVFCFHKIHHQKEADISVAVMCRLVLCISSLDNFLLPQYPQYHLKIRYKSPGESLSE